MLTKNDLIQIKELFKDEIKPMEQSIGSLQKSTSNLHATVNNLQKTTSSIQATIDDIQKTQRSMKRQLTRVEKDVRYVAADYDKRIVENHREIEKIKQYVGLA